MSSTGPPRHEMAMVPAPFFGGAQQLLPSRIPHRTPHAARVSWMSPKCQHVRDNMSETMEGLVRKRTALESHRPVPLHQEWEEVGITSSLKALVRCGGQEIPKSLPSSRIYQVEGVACLARVVLT
jgi:hypothetical protein